MTPMPAFPQTAPGAEAVRRADARLHAPDRARPAEGSATPRRAGLRAACAGQGGAA